MIEVEEALVVLIAPFVTGRFHPIALPDDLATYPAISYTLISNEPQNTMCGESNLDNARYRMDLYDVDRAAQLLLVRQIRTAMDKQFPFQCTCVGEYDLGFETQERLYHKAVDFSIWANKPDTQSP